MDKNMIILYIPTIIIASLILSFGFFKKTEEIQPIPGEETISSTFVFKPVRSIETPEPQGSLGEHIIDNGNGTFSDNASGLMWMIEDTGPASWKDALLSCEYWEHGGYSDWRLPNIQEMESLIRYSLSPNADILFSLTREIRYWTSTPISDTTALTMDLTEKEEPDFGIKNPPPHLRERI